MQLCALETHIRISRNLKRFVDLMRKHMSGPKPSPCPLQAQVSGPKISGNLVVVCNGSAWFLQDTLIGLQDYWRQPLASSSIVACPTASQTSVLRPVVYFASPSLCNRHFLEVRNSVCPTFPTILNLISGIRSRCTIAFSDGQDL